MEEKKSKKKKSMSTGEYKELCVKKHRDTYILDTVEYISMKDYVYPICKKHGQFKICAYDFAHLRGCPHCGRKNKKKTIFKRSRRNMNFDEFKIIAEQLHDNKYKYVRNSFVNLKTKMKIICPIHGEFEQPPHSHLNGHGCEKCGIIKRSLTQTITNEDFISKCVKTHNGYYDYAKTKYTGCYNDVDVVCPKHGLFTVPAYSHLQGHGCKKCATEKNALKLLKPLDTFIEDAKKKHPNENSDYSQVRYLGAKVPIEIVCPNGHHYWQKPNKHLSGHSCPYCAKIVSSYEMEIQDFLKSIGLSFETSKRNILSNSQEIDILIPHNNVAIEFDGLYWHSTDKRDKLYHLNKTNECKNKDINLIHIFEDEWIFHKNVVKANLQRLLSVSSTTINANDCIIKTVSPKEAKAFISENSIESYHPSTYRYGLYYNDELVMLLGIKKETIANYAIKNGYSVTDGLQCLINHISAMHNLSNLIVYVDKRWNNSSEFTSIGFKYVKDVNPRFYYIDGKHRTLHKPNDDKVYKIYDCGGEIYCLDF